MTALLLALAQAGPYGLLLLALFLLRNHLRMRLSIPALRKWVHFDLFFGKPTTKE